ncbi:MAG: efflux RND transporter periplasmic adaptor subunit [Chromatiales bacterium]|nr:efflux RND transporter periplasmic adaptor subunit [Chromatiales bacterium]
MPRVSPAWLLPAVLLVGCSGNDVAEPADGAVARPVEIIVLARAAEPVRRLPGRVVAGTRTPLAFQVPGELTDRRPREGQSVVAGEVLAELDPADYRLALREAEARLARLVTERERKRALYDAGILSGAAWEQLATEIELATVGREIAGRNLGQTRLLAPFDGRIAARLAESFTTVAAGEPVLLLQRDDTVDIAVQLASRLVRSLPLDERLQATARLPSDGAALRLRYQEHATEADPETGTFRLLLRGLPEDVSTWLPGMPVEVELQHASESPGVRVPLTALQADVEGRHFVWQVSEPEGRVHRKTVSVLAIEGDTALLQDALPEGLRIVGAGARFLSDDQPVRPLRD